MPTRVRGTEGVAGVHTSRTSIGTFAAWEEDGVHWTAGSAMGVDDLLEALDPLEISTDGVSDPTERFEVVWASPAIERSGYRVTNLEVIDDSGQHVYIRIDDTGTIALPTFGWVSYRELDDRPVLAGGNQTASVLADGSSVWLTVYAEAETTELDEEFIDTLLKSLRHREPDELTDLPPFTDGRGGAVMTEEPMCLE